MQKEKLASIALFIIVFGAVAIYVGATYGEDILQNIWQEEKVIQLGDCADIHYIGTLPDGTVFDSSYNDSDSKTGGNPLKVFISFNQTATPPTGYLQYSAGLIEGFMEGLIGLKEGQTATIGPIPPGKAYGANKISVGDTFTTKEVMYSERGYTFNQTFEVIEYTEEAITIYWVDVETLDVFTLPEGILLEDLETAYFSLYDSLPPFYIWENATQVINITNDHVELLLTPTTSENLSDELMFLAVGMELGIIFPDASTAQWDDNSVTIESSPLPGSTYYLDYMGSNLTIIVDNVTNENINVTIKLDQQEQKFPLNRTITFNRSYILRRSYRIPNMFADMIFMEDFEREGYSIHHLAGKELTFEVKIVEVYKTSQDN
ncbi:MAG: FKBP-type peptidyl-prolyl cis-trans isomerase [Thermoplasmatota archaeon]